MEIDVVMTKDRVCDLYELIENAAKYNKPVMFDDWVHRLDYLELKLIGKGELWITNLYWKDNKNNVGYYSTPGVIRYINKPSIAILDFDAESMRVRGEYKP